MKLKVLLFLTLFTSTAFAQMIPARVNVTILSGQITAQVFNPFFRPIVCNAQVFGQTIAGPVLTTYFTNQMIFPGTDRILFVQAFPTNPFITGRADVYCQFAYMF